jgi:hypothetical protein
MLRKKIQTLKVIIKTFFELWRAFGISVAEPYFIKNIFFKKFDTVGKKYHTKQYESLKKIVRSKYSFIIEKFKHKDLDGSLDNTAKIEKNIWMIWWQGIDENTPETVVKNIKRVKRLHPKWKINVITKYNYKKFAEIPYHMEKHIDNNDFSLTHISDYLRIVLLENYGGVYLDCNFFLLKNLDCVIGCHFYTIKHGTVSNWHVSKGLWTTGFLAAGRKNTLFSFLKEMYEAFFYDYSFVPSYFFIDAIIGLGYENIETIEKEIDMVPYNNVHYNFINSKGNEPFNAKVWNSVVDDTYALNANYKNIFQNKNDGKLTYFGYLYLVCDA